MKTERIKEIQSNTAYPESVSVQQALLQVWNECEQDQLRLDNATQANLSVCPDCFDRGELRNDKEEIIGTCPCHY
jgi:hypothetical protein